MDHCLTDPPRLERVDCNGCAGHLTFRPLRRGDYVRLVDLHRQLFPIEYDASFFEKACTGASGIVSWAAVQPVQPASLPALTTVGGDELPPPAGLQHPPSLSLWQPQKPEGMPVWPQSGPPVNVLDPSALEWAAVESAVVSGGGGGRFDSAAAGSLGRPPEPCACAGSSSGSGAIAGAWRPLPPATHGPGNEGCGSGGGGGSREAARELLLGFVTARAFHFKEIDQSDRKLLGFGDSLFDRDRAIYILTLGVDPAHRRRGVASSLLRCMLAYASRLGARVAYLHVISHNVAAQGFYASLGFRRRALLRSFYTIRPPSRQPRPGVSRYDACLYSAALPPPPDPRGLAAYLGGAVALALSSCLPPWAPAQQALRRQHGGGGGAWGLAASAAAARHKRDDDDGSSGALAAEAAEEGLAAQGEVVAPPWMVAAARAPHWLRSLFARPRPPAPPELH